MTIKAREAARLTGSHGGAEGGQPRLVVDAAIELPATNSETALMPRIYPARLSGFTDVVGTIDGAAKPCASRRAS